MEGREIESVLLAHLGGGGGAGAKGDAGDADREGGAARLEAGERPDQIADEMEGERLPVRFMGFLDVLLEVAQPLIRRLVVVVDRLDRPIAKSRPGDGGG